MATAAKKKKKETPLMGQYNQIKGKYPDAILLFRVGDFYETFGADAVTASKVLGIVLTKRANGSASHIELAGFPHHSLETYLPKLVKAGYRVAICDQLEDPKKTKKLVKRGVTELITPGVAANDNILDNRSNNFLASVYFSQNLIGAAFLDISTGEFYYTSGSAAFINKLIQSLNPAEIIYPKPAKDRFEQTFGAQHYTYFLEDWIFDFQFTRDKLLQHFETQSLKGFGMEDSGLSSEAESASITAAGAILHYLNDNQHGNLQHIVSIQRLTQEGHVWLDKFSIRNLELIYGTHPDSKCLIDVLDHTYSPMGARLLKKWLVMPLTTLPEIQYRQDAVAFFKDNANIAEEVKQLLKQCGDLERLISKAPLGKISPREVVQLKEAISLLPEIKQIVQHTSCKALQQNADQINPCPVLLNHLNDTITDDAPVQLAKGNVIKSGISAELDEYRNISSNGKQYLVDIQQREIEATGITSLKVGFNNVFGYYLEVTHAHKDKVPEGWIRKQTLTSAERYITEELKVLEQKILSAEEKIQQLEEQLFKELVQYICAYIEPIQVNAGVIARLDCLLSFATVAQLYQYVKPTVHEGRDLEIKGGRHPVIEQQLPAGERYVPNHVNLDPENQQIIIITGPNMSGKSAVLRQTALIVLMAQMGAFVPAEAANIGIVDKVFTRVGASDNISSGESTFMVEMNETAGILNNISDRSLIILDEIGRGTSTYDGISIAWSIAEFLHNHPAARPKTLFATHYHELNELASKYERIQNYSVKTQEAGQKVIFLRTLKPGGSKHSFGIHVARMAGMPTSLLDRATELLQSLEKKTVAKELTDKVQAIAPQNFQMSFFEQENPALAEIQTQLEQIDINAMTPVEALLKLQELKRHLK